MSGGQLDPALRVALLAAARTPHLLVACDYDGTLAPIVEDPSAAVPHAPALAALLDLAGLDRTTVAVVTGRSLASLSRLVELPTQIRRVGSHGSELDLGGLPALDDDAERMLGEVIASAEAITLGAPGVELERKPTGVAVHVRRASRPDAARVTAAVLAGPATLDGVHVIEGKEVVELSVRKADKGTALDHLRHETAAEVVVFLGDDVTDEHALERLTSPDVGVKVGAGTSAAAYRVDDPDGVAAVLATVGQERSRWLTSDA